MLHFVIAISCETLMILKIGGEGHRRTSKTKTVVLVLAYLLQPLEVFRSLRVLYIGLLVELGCVDVRFYHCTKRGPRS